MNGLIKALSIIFSVIAFLLVAIITVTNQLNIIVIIKRSLLAAVFFGILGGLIGYILINLTKIDNSKSQQNNSEQREEIKAVSQQQAAQQYANQNQDQDSQGTDEESDFQPLNLEKIDYEEEEKDNEVEEIDQLADQDPEKLAEMVKSLKGN
ncbi:hypothetical protein [Selenihalanaerobacter shriftii]|uniref:Uncharacterized protein n=1 Tax=Selenihalanaerobacter shriftii TaxID=142842 RepID=A0A1T4MD47_9FIRM|nr:hypothetical protein [Selenihalanaerobacter shriftii]SJZ64708.1 hypothetical protein SAMN02745118_01440 [Selenihalanaerobacter shriftii]